jgi:hypothetical protein
MKNSFFLYLIPAIFTCQSLTSQYSGCKRTISTNSETNDSVVLNQLKGIDKKKFIDRPVDRFLKHPVFSKYTSYHFMDEPLGVLSHLQIMYSSRVWVDIVVYEYKFTQQDMGSRRWKLDDYKKEKISRIDLVYNHTVLEETGYLKASDIKQ